jgi:NAD+ kinase
MSDKLRLLVIRSRKSRVDAAWETINQFLCSCEQPVDIVHVHETDDALPEDIEADLAIVLGGDGTIIRGCRKLKRNQIPIVGVNFGRLGFLADLSPEAFQENFGRFCEGRFSIVEHLMFECTHRTEDGQAETFIGVNEVAVSSAGALAMLDVGLDIDNESVTTFSCDGLIISTPVGSTAHSLSAGGPILRQELQAFVVTPICPHALTNRPIVDSADRVYTMTVPDAPEGVMVVIDGQIKRSVAAGDSIEVKRLPETFKLARLKGHSYYTTLHRKLGWGGQLRLNE